MSAVYAAIQGPTCWGIAVDGAELLRSGCGNVLRGIGRRATRRRGLGAECVDGHFTGPLNGRFAGRFNLVADRFFCESRILVLCKP